MKKIFNVSWETLQSLDDDIKEWLAEKGYLKRNDEDYKYYDLEKECKLIIEIIEE